MHTSVFEGQRNITLETKQGSTELRSHDMVIKQSASMCVRVCGVKLYKCNNISLSPPLLLPNSSPTCASMHVFQGVPTSSIYSWGKSDISGVTMDTVATELQYLSGRPRVCLCLYLLLSHTHTHTLYQHPRMQARHLFILNFLAFLIFDKILTVIISCCEWYWYFLKSLNLKKKKNS